MLPSVLHLFGEYLLQRRQPATGLFQFYEPSLSIRHTGYAVGDAALVDATELVRLAADSRDALDEIAFNFSF